MCVPLNTQIEYTVEIFTEFYRYEGLPTKSTISMGYSIIIHPFLGTPMATETSLCLQLSSLHHDLINSEATFFRSPYSSVGLRSNLLWLWYEIGKYQYWMILDDVQLFVHKTPEISGCVSVDGGIKSLRFQARCLVRLRDILETSSVQRRLERWFPFKWF